MILVIFLSILHMLEMCFLALVLLVLVDHVVLLLLF